MKSLIFRHIHPGRWIKITLSFKLQTQALNHAQGIIITLPLDLLIYLTHNLTNVCFT
jgi:hypothetical protein